MAVHRSSFNHDSYQCHPCTSRRTAYEREENSTPNLKLNLDSVVVSMLAWNVEIQISRQVNHFPLELINTSKSSSQKGIR
jgi:hypothetical protein